MQPLSRNPASSSSSVLKSLVKPSQLFGLDVWAIALTISQPKIGVVVGLARLLDIHLLAPLTSSANSRPELRTFVNNTTKDSLQMNLRHGAGLSLPMSFGIVVDAFMGEWEYYYDSSCAVAKGL